MDPWLAVGQSIASGITQGVERRDRKKMMEQEYAQRLRLMQEQQRLENAAPTPEMKLMGIYQQNPQSFQQFRMAMDPMAPQEMALKQAQFGLQQQNLGLERDKFNWTKETKAPGAGPTSQMQNFQFLMKLPGMTQEKALQYLYRPDLISQMMMMGGMGGMFGGGGAPNYGQ